MATNPPIKLYVTTYCGYCRAAERLLDQLGIPYDAENITNDNAKRAQLVAETGWRTVPIIFVGDELVGGFTELRGIVGNGQLDKKLAAAGYQRKTA